MHSMIRNARVCLATGMALVAASLTSSIAFAAAPAWEPTRPVEFVIPAGTGGGADQMARLIQNIVAKHNLMKQSLIPINKAGGGRCRGFPGG